MNWTIDRRFEDLEFHVRAKLVSSTWMDYEVFDLVLYDDGESESPYRFELKNPEENDYRIEYTTDVEKALIYIKGYIKFDGCINADIGSIHACSRQEIVRLGAIFEKLYDIAIELMPTNKEYLI